MPDYLITSTLKVFKTIDALASPETCKVERLVRAKNEAAALKHVVADTIAVNRASIDDAMRIAAQGGKVEIAAEAA